MSTANHSPPGPTGAPSSFDCKRPDCETTSPSPQGSVGAYCSPDCQNRDQGRRLLNLLRHDHRYCFTCFRKLKDVEDVPEWRRRRIDPVTESAVTGYQSHTEHARLGLVAEPRQGYGFTTRLGTVCECGNANTREREDLLREADIKSVVRSLHSSLVELRQEGQHDHHLDFHTLVRELRQDVAGPGGLEFARAVGAAITEAEA